MVNQAALRLQPATVSRQRRVRLPGWTGSQNALKDYGPVCALLLSTALLGQFGVGIARGLFVIGCLGVAARAYVRGGLPLHAQTVILLFVFAPLLRRIIDLHVGYDPNGSMLVGPLLALTAAFPKLRLLLSRRSQPLPSMLSYFVILVCLAYGWSISAFQGDFVQSTGTLIKYLIPMVYSICLLLCPEEATRVPVAAANTFLVISPMIGLYGVYQHLAPEPWDRYWMIASKIDSIGQPEPGKVRVFATMNSPVSFAAYATFGLLSVTFNRQGLFRVIVTGVLAIIPLSLALLLSSVRTAWISTLCSILICLIFKKLRGRAAVLLICLIVGVMFALLFTSFGDVVAQRLTSLNSNVSDDGSGGARLEDYSHVFSGNDLTYLVGVGFGSFHDSRMNALDGLLLSSAVTMGIVFGTVQTVMVLFLGARSAVNVRPDDASMRLVACALLAGSLVTFLLTNISIGEIGFLYWMMVGVLGSAEKSQASRVVHPSRSLEPYRQVRSPHHRGAMLG